MASVVTFVTVLMITYRMQSLYWTQARHQGPESFNICSDDLFPAFGIEFRELLPHVGTTSLYNSRLLIAPRPQDCGNARFLDDHHIDTRRVRTSRWNCPICVGLT